MLSSLRQATRSALPRAFTRYARPLTTQSAMSEQEKDNAAREEAMAILSDSSINPFATPPQEIVQQKPKVNLDAMHHHVPPAESPILQFLATTIMVHGEYAKAQKIVSKMLLHIYAMTRSPPMPIVEAAVMAASPAVRCRKQKQRGGKSTMKPLALSERQRTSLALKWIRQATLDEAKGAPGKKFEERLAREMVAIVKGTSKVLSKKEAMHKEAMVNRGSLAKRG